MFYRFSLKSLVARLAGFLLIAGIVGWLLDLFWPTLFFTTAVLLVLQYASLVNLIQWLWKKKTILPPEGKGTWAHAYDGIYRRIKKYRRRQKELNKIIKRFRDGSEALPDAAIVLNRDFTIKWSNRNTASLIGIRWPGDEGQRIDNLIRSPEFSKYLASHELASTCTVPSPIAPEIMVEFRLIEYGKDELLMLGRDVSQINRLEEMRRDFVANVSHELKTPLTVVRGYVEMVQSSAFDEGSHWHKAFTSIEMQVSRMDRLVEQLLILSRIEAYTDIPKKNAINVPNLLAQMVEDAKWLNQEKQHTITLNIESANGILGSESELKSAFSNLISNAIAYTPEQGQIDIVWTSKKGQMCFQVTDTGAGIKPEHLNRLTERFYRVDKSRSRNTGGSGLGLSIVKHVLQHHNAELDIKSRWGQGSIFTILFNPIDTIECEPVTKLVMH